MQISVLYAELMDVPKNTEYSIHSTIISDEHMLCILRLGAQTLDG